MPQYRECLGVWRSLDLRMTSLTIEWPCGVSWFGGKLVKYYQLRQGASGGIMVSKLDKQTFKSEFESHWVPYSYGLVPHLSKKKVL